MAEKLSGIIDPPIDDLLSKVDSKYQLVIFASKRARQINDYYADLHEGSLFDNVGPLVDSSIDDKPLSVAMHEINEDKLRLRPIGRVARPSDVAAEHRRRHHRRHRGVQGRRRRARARARRATTSMSCATEAALRFVGRPTLEAISPQPGAHRPLRGRRRGAPRRASARRPTSS